MSNFQILQEDPETEIFQPDTPVNISVGDQIKTTTKSVKHSRGFIIIIFVVAFVAVSALLSSAILLKGYYDDSEEEVKPTYKVFQPELQEIKITFPPRNLIEGWRYPKEHSPLFKACNNTEWKPNVFIHCTTNTRGLTNVRAEIATCVRWAIDAGVGLIMPKVMIRDRKDLAKFHWDRDVKNMSYYFDEVHFTRILKEQCPKLIIKDDTEIKTKDRITSPHDSWEETFEKGGFKNHIEVLLNNTNWNPKSNNETIIQIHNSLWGWSFYKEFIMSQVLKDVVQYNPEITKFVYPLLAYMPSKYLGFHLRAEGDQHWHTPEELYGWFKKHYIAKYSEFKTVYLAVGNRTLEEQFRNATKELGLKVISKSSIVAHDKDFKKLIKQLSFDQQGILDYEVLKRSTYFFGVAQSSFSWGIAYQRGNSSITNCDCELIGYPDSYFVTNY